MALQIPKGANFNHQEMMSFLINKEIIKYKAFKNFGWEKLYVQHQMKMLKLIDLFDNIHRLFLLSQLHLRDFNTIDSWYSLSIYKLPRDPKAIDLTNKLKIIFENADPIYLDLVGELYVYNEEGITEFIQQETISKNSSYPKLNKYNAQMKIVESLKNLTVNFRVNHFLDLCPDPIKYCTELYEKQEEMFNGYKFDYLVDRYPNISVYKIRPEYEDHDFNLSLTVDKLEEIIRNPNDSRLLLKRRRTSPSGLVNFLADIEDMNLLIELSFIENKEAVVFHKEATDLQRKSRVENARKLNLLYDCECCCETEFLDVEISCCPKGHTFCLPCIQKFVELEVGIKRLEFKCMTECTEMFNLEMLKQIVDDKLYQRLMRLKQAEEMKAANIEGLETCAFCDYSAIVPEDHKIFTCLHPDCRKETCRSCREENHIPLKCDENERTPELQVRTMIENKMSEVLIRTCPNCNNKFLKESGCNRMKCICGTCICYICKKEISDCYDHFYHDNPMPNKCPLRTDDNISHVAAVEAACRLTIKNLRETKPDLLSKVDVDKILPPISNTNEEENKEEPSNSMTNQVIASILDEKVERINSLQDMRSFSPDPKRPRLN